MRARGIAAFFVLFAGCSQHVTTPDDICTQMISTCHCFDDAFRSFCVDTINGYHPTQEQLDCANAQTCTTLCNETTLVSLCYTPLHDAAMPPADAGHDAGHDAAPSANDAGNDAAAVDAAASSDAGTDAAAVTCASLSSCGACTAITGCGWCRNRALCLDGTPAGPTGGGCPAAQWSGTAASCP